MTKQTYLDFLQAAMTSGGIREFQTLRVGSLTVERTNRNYDVRLSNHTYAGGRLPALADPSTFPIAMALAVVHELDIAKLTRHHGDPQARKHS